VIRELLSMKKELKQTDLMPLYGYKNGTEESDIMIMDNESEINLNATQGAKSIFPSTEEVKVMGESQLKRIEEKLERVIGLLEGKRLDDSSSGKLTTVYSSDQDA